MDVGVDGSTKLPLPSPEQTMQLLAQMNSTKPLVFLSYATPDRQRVVPYFDYLEAENFSPWMDFRSIKAGQNWDLEIRRALDRATIIVVFVSENSYDRRSYLQREIKIALQKLEEKLTTDIYIIPVLLDDQVAIPDQIKSIQSVKVSEGRSEAAIADAIRHQLSAIGSEIQEEQRRENVQWSSSTYKESWEGLPGYEFEYTYLTFSSKKYKNLSDIGHFIRGEIIDLAMSERRVKFNQDSDMYDFGQEEGQRQNTLEAHCADPFIAGKMISVQYSAHYYGAGAAHPNMFFKTFAFVMDPLVRIPNVQAIFKNADSALALIQSHVRKALMEEQGAEEERYTLDEEWVVGGTSSWEDFQAFVFKEDGIQFLFSPYSVAAYVFGPQFALVSYNNIFEEIQDLYASILGISHLGYRKKMGLI